MTTTRQKTLVRYTRLNPWHAYSGLQTNTMRAGGRQQKPSPKNMWGLNTGIILAISDW